MVSEVQENSKGRSVASPSPDSASNDLPMDLVRLHINLSLASSKKLPSGHPNQPPQNISPCQLIQRFRPGVEAKDHHRYHLVRTATGTVALHRYDPDIGCVRTANFRWTPITRQPNVYKDPFASESWRSTKVLKNEVDVNIIRRWLGICTSSHLNCRLRRNRDLPPSMKIIDCRDLTIVSWETGMKFAALSYTWEATEEPNPTVEEICPENQLLNRLPSNLPATVKDAIDLINQLDLDDLRYLWIDRYCIDQHYLEEKHEQIQQMHLIYSNAEVTIIAAAGENADSGLPGLSASRTSHSYLSCDAGPLVFVEENKNIITQSSWMRRGWTFQEAVFSRRRLFFTSEQVIFECANMTAHEVLQIPLKYGIGCGLKPLFGLHLSNTAGQETRPFSYYVEEYSRRILTYESDALNAFSGILHALQEGRSQLRHHWAIEINSCTSLTCQTRGRRGRCRCSPTMSLLWDHEQDYGLSHRRHEYPSWSWLGWKGPVTFSGVKSDTSLNVQMWAERVDGSLQQIGSKSDADDLTFNRSAYSHFIHIRACTFDIKMHCDGNKVLMEHEGMDGKRHTALIQSGNTSLMTGEMAGETIQAILLNRHDSLGWHSIMASILIVKQDGNGAASSRVGVCEVKWYPFCYAAEKAGEIRTIRLG